jgi:hypothetical protein
MSFQVITAGRRARGLGVNAFVSEETARAGVAIGEALRSGRAASRPMIADFIVPNSEEAPTFDSGPSETFAGAELDCGCMAKRATEALINLGADPAELGDAQAECEADPDAFYAAVAGFFANGEIPPCVWYEIPWKRNVVLGIGAFVALRRRKR